MTVQAGRRIKLGIVASEFFERSFGRMGGFGWAAHIVGKCFSDAPELGVDVAFLHGESSPLAGKHEDTAHGIPLIFSRVNKLAYLRRVHREKIDILITIDYRSAYDNPLFALPRTPVILWVHDPRPPEDIAKVNTLRIPESEEPPKGIEAIDCTGLARLVRLSRVTGRKILFASPAPQLIQKVPHTYSIELAELPFLPNIIPPSLAISRKSQRPSVVFLGRLDPIKRPWVFAELGARLPSADFFFLGQSHFTGPGAWTPPALPPNLHVCGHIDGEEKRRALAAAWVLVNTSIHEALPISFLEALSFEVPILSCQDPEDLVSRFGVFVGRWDGSGMEAVPLFERGLHRLIDNDELRLRLGHEGRNWVAAHHSRAAFLQAFFDLCKQAGVCLPTVVASPTR